MRHLFLHLLIALLTISLTLTLSPAEAKRFGGGKSFGVQRSVTQPSPSRSAPHNAPQQPQQSSASKWLGPLAGLAVGGLLASLFMGHGLGTGILSWILLAGVAWVAWSFIRKRWMPQVQQSTAPAYASVMGDARTDYTPQSTYVPPSAATNIPGFNEEDFLHNAKARFIRMQEAFDRANINDLREFTTPEVFAETKLQIQERGSQSNYTEVVTLNAELLEAKMEMGVPVASVQFSGDIREELNGAANPFREIWHFREDGPHSGWVVAGIQQY